MEDELKAAAREFAAEEIVESLGETFRSNSAMARDVSAARRRLDALTADMEWHMLGAELRRGRKRRRDD